MIVKVNIDGRTYEVQIEDINKRPVVATVDGQRFEVHPENGGQVAGGTVQAATRPEPAMRPVAPASAPVTTASSITSKTLTSPLPGTVISVFVKPGDEIETGQVMLIIEAMKMKNSIRSTRAGIISEVLVSEGQTVAHKQPLVTFADAGEASWI